MAELVMEQPQKMQGFGVVRIELEDTCVDGIGLEKASGTMIVDSHAYRFANTDTAVRIRLVAHWILTHAV